MGAAVLIKLNSNFGRETMAKKLFMICVLVSFVVLPGMTWAADALGVTDDEIKIGQWGPQTGPAAFVGCCCQGNREFILN